MEHDSSIKTSELDTQYTTGPISKTCWAKEPDPKEAALCDSIYTNQEQGKN